MIHEIKCNELQQIVAEGGQLIDVRSNIEFSTGALKSAVNMPIESIPYFAETMDKDKPVLLYCVSGRRASMVKQFLESLGFDEVYNLGGFKQLAHC